MLSQPELEDRPAQHYVAITVSVAMDDIGSVLPPLIQEVFGWLGRNGIEPAGPPFFRYLLFDLGTRVKVAVGVPVVAPLPGDDRIQPGKFPAGCYVTAIHTGPYEYLVDSSEQLLKWGEANDVSWQVEGRPDGEHWGGRTEFYLNSPRDEPDPQKWQTQLAFLLASKAQ